MGWWHFTVPISYWTSTSLSLCINLSYFPSAECLVCTWVLAEGRIHFDSISTFSWIVTSLNKNWIRYALEGFLTKPISQQPELQYLISLNLKQIRVSRPSWLCSTRSYFHTVMRNILVTPGQRFHVCIHKYHCLKGTAVVSSSYRDCFNNDFCPLGSG